MNMNITDRECHHIVMGAQRYRCIQYANNHTIALLCESAMAEDIIDGVKQTATVRKRETTRFRKHVSEYMDDLIEKSLNTERRLVFADVGAAQALGMVCYTEIKRMPNGDIAHHHGTAPSVDALMEGL